MPFFSRRVPYDRRKLLRDAEAACEKRRWRHAARCYGQILAAEPNNADLHYRIAPLLARIGHHLEAWESFHIAGQSPEITGSSAHTLTLYRTATQLLPTCFDAWRELSRAFLRDQQPDAALRVLREARQNFKGRRRRPEALILLREMQKLDPWNPEVVLDLCRLLAKRGRKAEALYMLDELDRRVAGHMRSRARALAWRIDPTFLQTWRWMRSDKESRRARSKNTAHRVRRRA